MHCALVCTVQYWAGYNWMYCSSSTNIYRQSCMDCALLCTVQYWAGYNWMDCALVCTVHAVCSNLWAVHAVCSEQDIRGGSSEWFWLASPASPAMLASLAHLSIKSALCLCTLAHLHSLQCTPLYASALAHLPLKRAHAHLSIKFALHYAFIASALPSLQCMTALKLEMVDWSLLHTSLSIPLQRITFA